MTTFPLPLLPPGLTYATRSATTYASSRTTSSYCYALSHEDAQDDFDTALASGTVDAQALALFLGALVQGLPASLLLHQFYPRASCDCCNDHDQTFLTVV